MNAIEEYLTICCNLSSKSESTYYMKDFTVLVKISKVHDKYDFTNIRFCCSGYSLMPLYLFISVANLNKSGKFRRYLAGQVGSNVYWACQNNNN